MFFNPIVISLPKTLVTFELEQQEILIGLLVSGVSLSRTREWAYDASN